MPYISIREIEIENDELEKFIKSPRRPQVFGAFFFKLTKNSQAVCFKPDSTTESETMKTIRNNPYLRVLNDLLLERKSKHIVTIDRADADSVTGEIVETRPDEIRLKVTRTSSSGETLTERVVIAAEHIRGVRASSLS